MQEVVEKRAWISKRWKMIKMLLEATARVRMRKHTRDLVRGCMGGAVGSGDAGEATAAGDGGDACADVAGNGEDTGRHEC